MKCLILCEGKTDALVIHHVVEMLRLPSESFIPKDAMLQIEKPLEKDRKTKKALLEQIKNHNLCVTHTRGNDLLKALPRTIAESIPTEPEQQKTTIIVICDDDHCKNDETEKVIKKLENEKKAIPDAYAHISFDYFCFEGDLEKFLIDYVKQTRPEWYKCVTTELNSCLKKCKATDFESWESSKNQELFLRLIHSAKDGNGEYIEKFPEQFIAYFGLNDETNLRKTDDGEKLLNFLREKLSSCREQARGLMFNIKSL
ncbi:hypothetical protein P0082_05015 [Candidatus Haliotispira prima]|uniref:DUF4276 family protein n=1 Tax=Candidatus Haliotispira prima TaxID=3034016 RepID=A0ABY8MM15_9SPIO|nr:hypothetical protein P0082_05015 [Candidatus Haliotispira prima]